MILEKLINKVHLGDCLDFMAKLPDGCIDLVVTDSPYGIAYVQNHISIKHDTIENDDFEDTKPLLEKYFKECYRIMKEDSALYSFCSWHKVGWFQQELEKYFQLKNLIVWNKNTHGTGDLKGSYGPKHELVWFCHKGRPLLRGDRPVDVINCEKVNSIESGHPTPKPTKLLEMFIKTSSDEGDIVFDGFAGSGSTGVAAVSVGRRFVGCELIEKYQQIAQKRIDVAEANINNFTDLFTF
jgi:site-specific DNA-methyltransferase (adenine-specific)